MAGPPNKIIIIRHGEKPPTHPGKKGPFDVKEDGKSGKGNSLIVTGWQRAGALNAFFAPHKGKPPKKEVATPDYIYAADPKSESERPYETVTPLAAWLGYKEKTAQFNISYKIGGGEPQLVESVLGLSGVVLICWEHDHIKYVQPSIVDTLHSKIKIKNYSSIPSKWPDVFYMVWIFNLNHKGTSYKWHHTKQDLMAGDLKS
jgi:hypothetical protein